MTLPEEPESGPELTIHPTSLFFGSSRPSILKIGKPDLIITISNTGKGTLSGRLKPLVSWLTISPYEFNCGEGESSDHNITIQKNARQYWDTRGKFLDNLILVISNAGSVRLDGSYKTEPANLPRTVFSWFMVTAGLLIISALVVMGLLTTNWNGSKNISPISIEQLYTQGAATEFSRLALTPSPTFTVTSTIFLSPTPAVSPLPALTLTFTPWPRASFPSPEEFIKNYYTMIKNKQFDKAWLLLSPKMKETYCAKETDSPCDDYKTFWAPITKLDIVSVFLQKYDTNPAEVYVKLNYTDKSGSTESVLYDCFIIADSTQAALLLDIIKTIPN